MKLFKNTKIKKAILLVICGFMLSGCDSNMKSKEENKVTEQKNITKDEKIPASEVSKNLYKVELKDIYGNKVNLSDFKGKKVYILGILVSSLS